MKNGFDATARCKSGRSMNVKENYFNKRSLLASGLGASKIQEAIFFSASLNDLCDRLLEQSK